MAKSRLTRATIDDLASFIAAGLSQSDACHLAGVAPSTLARWLKQATDLEEPGIMGELAAAMDRAKAEFKNKHIQGIEAAGLKDWRARAWLLERICPAEFGRRVEVQQDVSLSGPPPVIQLVPAAGVSDVLKKEHANDTTEGAVL